MEFVIKIVVTLIALLMIWGISSFTVNIWRSHIDPQKTFENVIAKFQKKPIDVLATRDPNALYQSGKVVGRVTGEISEKGEVVIFEDISDTSNLNKGKNIEFRRLTLRVESVESITGMKVIVSETGTSTRTAVMSNVKCRIVSRE